MVDLKRSTMSLQLILKPLSLLNYKKYGYRARDTLYRVASKSVSIFTKKVKFSLFFAQT